MRTIITLLILGFSLLLVSAQNVPTDFKETSFISKYDSLSISVLMSVPEEEPKAIVQLVHGMCDYKERYIPFIKFLNQKGYVCIIHDHRGHGNSIFSDDDLGYFYSGGYQAMISDVYDASQLIRNQYPGLKLYLFGHSMGSMVVRSYSKHYDDTIDGLIVCGSPSYNTGSIFGKGIARRIAKRKGGHYRSAKIQKLVFGGNNKHFKDESSQNAWVCSDPDIVAAYDADPKCNFIFTANGFQNLFGLMGDVYSKKGWQLKQPAMPVWFISGTDDPVMIRERKFMSAVKNMQKVGYKNVDYNLYPDMRHEILNEIEKEKVWGDVVEKLQQWQKLR